MKGCLDLAAWTLDEPVVDFALDLEPPLRLRLCAALPQVLSGAEKFALLDFAFQWTDQGNVPLALPLVSDLQELIGTLVLLDAPVFDLEEENFVECWKVFRARLIQGLSPGILAPTGSGRETLLRHLESGRKILALEFPLGPFTRQALADREPAGPRIRSLYRNLKELTGQNGVLISLYPESLVSFHPLSPRMEPELFVHQLEQLLPLPAGFKPGWTIRLLQSGRDADEYLTRKGLLFPS